MKNTRISVVLTSHNRKDKTLRCIRKLHDSAEKCVYKLQVRYFLCDDASSDGTVDAVKSEFPDVSIVIGDGDLFWARGMATAMEIAEKSAADFYMMVNDDVDFSENTFDVMLDSYFSADNELCAIVGSTCSKDHQHTYGGLIWNKKAIGESSIRIIPNGEIQECNLTNWNCFLISVRLYNQIGKIDNHYEHSAADYDYSNRIIAKGYKIFVAKEYIGICEKNSIKNTWRDSSLPFQKRWRLLHRKNGVPAKSNWYYCRKYYGIWAPYQFIKPYIGLLMSSIRRGKDEDF